MKVSMKSIFAALPIAAALFISDVNADTKDLDCVAEKPFTGILNVDKLRDFETREDDFSFFEIGHLIDDPSISLTVEAGGCYHYGVALTFVFDDAEPIDNKTHYVKKVRSLLDKTPFKQDSLGWKSDFLQALDKHENDAEALRTGEYDLQPGYSTVYLTTSREGPRVSLTILQDIAL